MSENPLSRVQAGEELRFSAQRENLISDVIASVLRGGGTSVPSAEYGGFDPTMIRVRNDTGEDLARFSVIQIGDPIFGPDDNLDEFKNRPVFKGEAIETGSEKYAVVQEPIAKADGTIQNYGLARVSGCTIAKVDCVSANIEEDETASCSDEPGAFDGDTAGTIQILWREGKEGEQWAIVHLRGGGSGGAILLGKADAAIAKGASGRVSLWTLPTSPWSLCPDGQGTRGSWTNETGLTTNLYQSVHDDPAEPDDTKYIKSSTVSDAIFLTLRNTPANFDEATAVKIVIRCKKTASKKIKSVRIYKANETDPLTAEATITDSTDYTNYTLKPDLTGDVDKTSWDGARLKIELDSTGSSGEVRVAAVTVFVTYSKIDATEDWSAVVDSCKDVKAYARLGAVKIGKWVYVKRFAQGYEVINAEC